MVQKYDSKAFEIHAKLKINTAVQKSTHCYCIENVFNAIAVKPAFTKFTFHPTNKIFHLMLL